MNQKAITRGSIHLDLEREANVEDLIIKKSGLNHGTSLCFRVIGVCLAYGKLDYKIKDCPLQKKKEPSSLISSAHARVHAIPEHDFRASNSMVEDILYIYDRMSKILFDHSSDLYFIS
ncbi:unnamed protein product [Musa textilis]